MNNYDARLEMLERKLTLLARRLNVSLEEPSAPPASVPAAQRAAPTSPVPAPTIPIEASTGPSASRILGYAGVACLLLAIVLLIRLSIESGWLTPVRQLALAAGFGALLIGLPFSTSFKFKDYISQLPALGVVILHLAIYGGVFYHHILDENTALLLVSAVGILSLALLKKFAFDAYVLISIFGTYTGALALKAGFSSTFEFFCFLMVWNFVYCAFAIATQRRKVILITSYVAIGLVSLKALQMPMVDGETLRYEYIKVAVAQMFQFFVFLSAVTVYTISNKQLLTKDEAWSFFPLVLFFYGLEYNLLDKVNPDVSTVFSLVFAGIILGAYMIARRGRSQALESADVAFTSVAAVLAHSIYFVLLNDTMRIATPFLFLTLGLSVARGWFGQGRFRGVFAVVGLVSIYSFCLMFTAAENLDQTYVVSIGLLYGVVALALSGKVVGRSATKGPLGANLPLGANIQQMLLTFAHWQVMLAIYRMKGLWIDRSVVAAVWVVYAFAVLVVAMKLRDRVLAQTSLPIIALGLLRFLLVDFSRLESGARILALLAMGALIFVGGYLYKKTTDSTAKA